MIGQLEVYAGLQLHARFNDDTMATPAQLAKALRSSVADAIEAGHVSGTIVDECGAPVGRWDCHTRSSAPPFAVPFCRGGGRLTAERIEGVQEITWQLAVEGAEVTLRIRDVEPDA